MIDNEYIGLTKEQLAQLFVSLERNYRYYVMHEDPKEQNTGHLMSLASQAVQELQQYVEARTAISEDMLKQLPSRELLEDWTDGMGGFSGVNHAELACMAKFIIAQLNVAKWKISQEGLLMARELHHAGQKLEETRSSLELCNRERERLHKELEQYRKSKSEDREQLKRLAVILSGSDAPGEIKALTVTAQSFVDRCKALSYEQNISAQNFWYLVSWRCDSGRYGHSEIRLDNPWGLGDAKKAMDIISDFNNVESVIIKSVFPVTAPFQSDAPDLGGQ